MHRPPKRLHGCLSLLLAGTVLLIVACGADPQQPAPAPINSARPIITSAAASQTPAVVAAPQLPSDPTLIAVVNKTRGLSPPTYVPPDLVRISPEFTSSVEIQMLRAPASEALTRMLSDARSQGIFIKVNSGYRSYDYQAADLRGEIISLGCAQALQEVAPPGHSEHQLGLAVDLTSADVGWDLVGGFGQTPEGKWLAANAATYGFVLSYPSGKAAEAVTGYISEPWHYRYVTPPMAQAIVASGKIPSVYLLSLGSSADTGIVQSDAGPPSGFGCG